ncbi:hypothetical protein ABZ835_44195 [Streptomyces sp. NPDC047461]|uniref:hypothetical protein n=1 Tax=Streptomyces sp. NPDC047461 TaxID=3155619 RepID=UPI0033CFEC51
MISYALTWTGPDGINRAPAVAYDKPSSEGRKTELEQPGCTNVEVVQIEPGRLPEPKA